MPTSRIPYRRRLRISRDAPSSVSSGILPVHVLAGVEPWIVEGSSIVNPTDWAIVSILSSRLLTRTELGPDGGGDRHGKH